MPKRSPSPLKVMTDAKAQRFLGPAWMALYHYLRESPWENTPYEAIMNILVVQRILLERLYA